MDMNRSEGLGGVDSEVHALETSMDVWLRLARSHAPETHEDLRRELNIGLRGMTKKFKSAFEFLGIYSWAKWLTRRLSKSSPPKWASSAL